MKIGASAPHFFVRDINVSVKYYVEVLDFKQPQLWGEPPVFAMPSRNGFIVMLNQADSVTPSPNGRLDCWDAYFWCDRVLDYYEEIRTRGADMIHGPEERELYGMREIAVRDPDGYMLVFAEDMAEDQGDVEN